ncbi:MAG TPA: TIM-barrel domain-containing protein [Opitutaceae bacterium]|nr:TIM-barrel domain-containing protein [Opitutaceae bacterium]
MSLRISRSRASRVAHGDVFPALRALALGAALLLGTATATRAADAALHPRWQVVAPGVWKAIVGTPEDFSLLSAAGQSPLVDALRALPAAEFPLDANEIEARVAGRRTALRFPLALDEDVYGLGVDFLSLRRTGSVFQLHEDHWSGRPGRTHAPVPFYVSTRGFGVLVDSARYLDVYVGLGVRLAAPDKPPVIDRTTDSRHWSSRPRSDSVEIAAPAPGVAVYVFAGPTPLDAVRRYNLFCGGGALPPKWGLGFLTRTPTAYTAQQALAEVDAFRARGIPLDMLGLEPGWQDHVYPCSFEWDAKRFPDPAGFLRELAQRHVRANLWFNPYVSPTAPLYAKLLPFAGSHLVWNGIVPDYSLAEPRQIFAEHLRKTVVQLNPAAVGGFKIDEVDGNDQWMWPDHATFPSGHDGEQLRQTYGVLLQRTVLGVFHDLNRRTLGQVRGTNAGASPFPFVIYNDNYNFDEYITAVANTSFAGVLWSPEVRAGSGEDMLRRVQAVCFSPLALFNGWATDTKLWSHPEVADAIRDAIVLRERLLPYWYTTFAQYRYQGTPVIRALPLVAGFSATNGTEAGKLDATANPYAIGRVAEVKDQYLVGDALLVAPIAPGVATRKVTLPPGRWYDFYTGKFAGENTVIEVTPPLAQIPLFVKDGALIPLIPERSWAPTSDETVPLEIRHYGESAGEWSLYDDDGETFDYERGAFSWTKLRATKDATGAWRGEATPARGAPAWHYATVTWRFMPPAEAAR